MPDKKILTVYGENKSEKIIERSRFITYSKHVESEEEARAFLVGVRAEHSLATHVCYAFICDKLGNLCRFSDDGEPQGTAGMPILEVLKNKGLYQTAVAVVRYFGGVKLGAGGLVRAYSSSAAENLSDAEIRSVEVCSELLLTVDYTGVDAAQKYFTKGACTVLTADYGEKVTFCVVVKKTDKSGFIEGFLDFMLGKAQVKENGEYDSLTQIL